MRRREKIYSDGLALLKEITEKPDVRARAVTAIYPANSRGTML
ncbi:MAG: hypothetical protein R2744_09460 [Bacteroidales bacterium]